MIGNKYSFVNKKTGEILFSFYGEVDTAYVFVWQMDKNTMFANESGLEHWLNQRAYLSLQGKTKSQVIKELGIEESKEKFTKMQDGHCLYAYLRHFVMETDDFAIYPSRDDVFACLFSDSRFYRIYAVAALR